MIRILLLVFILTLYFPVSSQITEITGYLNDQNYTPNSSIYRVPGAIVYLYGTEHKVQSDLDGEFSIWANINELNDNSFLLIYHPDFEFKLIDLSNYELSNAINLENIVLNSKKHIDLYINTFSNEKFFVEGHIRDNFNNPVNNAEIRIKNLYNIYRTDNDGYFSIPINSDFFTNQSKELVLWINKIGFQDTLINLPIRNHKNLELELQLSNYQIFKERIQTYESLNRSLRKSLTEKQTDLQNTFEEFSNFFTKSTKESNDYYLAMISKMDSTYKERSDSLRKFNKILIDSLNSTKVGKKTDYSHFFAPQLSVSPVAVNYPQEVLRRMRLEGKLLFFDEKISILGRRYFWPYKNKDIKQSFDLGISTIFREKDVNNKIYNLFFEIGSTTSFGKRKGELTNEYPGYIGLFLNGGIRWRISNSNLVLGLSLEYDRNWLSKKFNYNGETYYHQEILLINFSILYRNNHNKSYTELN